MNMSALKDYKNGVLIIKNWYIEILYVNQPSSISKRELPYSGPVRTGEGARD